MPSLLPLMWGHGGGGGDMGHCCLAMVVVVVTWCRCHCRFGGMGRAIVPSCCHCRCCFGGVGGATMLLLLMMWGCSGGGGDMASLSSCHSSGGSGGGDTVSSSSLFRWHGWCHWCCHAVIVMGAQWWWRGDMALVLVSACQGGCMMHGGVGHCCHVIVAVGIGCCCHVIVTVGAARRERGEVAAVTWCQC